MPSEISPRAILRRLVEDPKASVKVRLGALERLKSLGAPVALLQRILRDPQTPARLLKVALDIHDAKEAIRKWNKQRGATAGTGNPNVLGSK